MQALSLNSLVQPILIYLTDYLETTKEKGNFSSDESPEKFQLYGAAAP